MKRKCCNCQFSGTPFKLGGFTHQYCEFPIPNKEDYLSGKLDARDLIMKFSDSCDKHLFEINKWKKKIL